MGRMRDGAGLVATSCGMCLLGAALQADVPSATGAMLIPPYEFHEPTNGPKPQAFGAQVAISADGRTLAVADPWYFGGSVWPWYGSGAVYVYGATDEGWQLHARLEPPDPQGYDFFGADLSLSADGSVLAIGAEFEGRRLDPRTGDGFGAVFVFTREGGAWLQQAHVQSPKPQRLASFGRTVELSESGDTLVVGAPFESISVEGTAQPSVGAVYVYRRSAAAWESEAVLRAPQPQADDRFGTALRLSANGRVIAVLAGEQNPDTENLETGEWDGRNNTLYVFEQGPNAWQLTATLEGDPAEPFFGGSAYATEGQMEGFALNGDGSVLAVASPVGAGVDGEAGYVRFYQADNGGWVRTQTTLVPALAERVQFGLRLTLSTDGATLAAAALRDEGPYGRPYVVVFRDLGMQWSQVAAIESPSWPDPTSFGSSLALSGTGERLVIGAQHFATESNQSGAAFVY
ncbi:MAG: hypothetical protein DIU71_05815 [Proteobacteria bacterium]|nr:MAG: hypothetical protein DIU71_05815 [Pseudomonadota bacterium]